MTKTNTNKVLSILCVLVLSGCAVTTGTTTMAKPTATASSSSKWADRGLKRLDAAGCSGTECTIAVRASDCELGISPYYLIVTKRNVLLRWVIQDKGYTFPASDGIFFKPNSIAGSRAEFDRCGRVNPTTWQCMDRNVNPPMAFWYGVKILKPDGRTLCTIDPVIINDNGFEEYVE